jgi:hypothetical protein
VPRGRKPARPPDPAQLYAEGLNEDELTALAIASTLEGVDAELAILRVLIRRVIVEGDVDTVRRAMLALSQLLMVKRKLSTGEVGELQGSLNRVLDTLGEELGTGKL